MSGQSGDVDFYFFQHETNLIGGRAAHPFITVASNLDIVEEYDTSTDQFGPQKARMPTARSGGGSPLTVAEFTKPAARCRPRNCLGAFRALEAYDRATNAWTILSPMPLPRHGVATAF